MRNTVNILGIPIDNVSMDEALNVVKGFLSEDRVHTVYTPNSEIMMAAQRDPELKKILCEADRMPYRCRHSGKRIYSLKFKNVRRHSKKTSRLRGTY